MVIFYDPASLSWTFLFRWRGTIFPLVLSDPMFWLLLGVHFWLLRKQTTLLEEDGHGLPELDFAASTTSLSLLTFFVVFYGSHCYERYFLLHSHTIGVSQSIRAWAQLIQSHFAHAELSPRVPTPCRNSLLAELELEF